jgi:hypothetical protein
MDNTEENRATYDKPDSMTVKEFVMKRTALSTGVPHNIVKTVIDNQFRTALEALTLNNSLEIAGLGKFIYHESKAKQRLVAMEVHVEKLENSLLNEEVLEEEIDSVHQEIFKKQVYIKEIRTKINLKK